MQSSSSSIVSGPTSTRTISTAPFRSISVGHGAMAAPAEPSTHWSKKPLTLRIISAAVLIPIVVAAVYAGHPAWDLLVILFAGVMAWEWISIAVPSRQWRVIAAAVLVAANVWVFAFRGEMFNALVLLAVLFVALIVPACRRAASWL